MSDSTLQDCGDEYRKEPFLTASGDLKDHLDKIPNAYAAEKLPGHTDVVPRLRVSTGTSWETLAGFSRGMRAGTRVCISGTTATASDGTCVGGTDVVAQTTFVLDIIEASLKVRRNFEAHRGTAAANIFLLPSVYVFSHTIRYQWASKLRRNFDITSTLLQGPVLAGSQPHATPLAPGDSSTWCPRWLVPPMHIG